MNAASAAEFGNGNAVPIQEQIAFAGAGGCDCPPTTPLYQRYWREAGQGGSVGKMACVVRLDASSPSPTLQKANGNGGVFHPTECRAISTSERRRLGSFPDPFRFTGWRDAIERIGIDPEAVSPDHWRHVHNRLAAGHEPRTYTLDHHRAFLLRRKAES